MEQDIRHKLINEVSKIQFPCLRHPDQIANMFIIDDSSANKGFICSNCYADLLQSEQKSEVHMKPLKFIFSQIHQSCTTLLSDLNTSAFIDHHLNLIRTLAKNHLPHVQQLVQASITNYFQKYRDFITGRYFQQFYVALSSIVSLYATTKSRQHQHQINANLKKIVDFAINFQKFNTEYEDYSNLTLEQKLKGQGILRQIKSQIGEIYKQFREKITANKKSENLVEQIIHLFNPKSQCIKFYRFSPTLMHSSLKLIDPKKIKLPDLPDLPDNEYTLMALIQPSIGSQKRTIKFKMQGIKGWMSVGIAIRKKVQQNQFKFQSTSAHGTYQISYDGYCWSQDSSVNEQYTSWYYNQGDTVTLTVNPIEGELVYVKNSQTHNPYTLKFKVQKKDKLYFCASMNYSEDSVSILQ